MTDFITQIDFNILNAIQSIRTPFLDTIMPLITFLGSGGIVWAVTALIMLCFKKSRKTAKKISSDRRRGGRGVVLDHPRCTADEDA